MDSVFTTNEEKICMEVIGGKARMKETTRKTKAWVGG
jgi:hypothetical protein